MSRLGIGTLIAVGGLLLARSRIGLWIGNQARALSDRIVLATLQWTSEFEKEL